MKSVFKKGIALLLIVIMLLPGMIVAGAETSSGNEYVDPDAEIYPIVYVIGKVDTIYKDVDDPSSETVYPPSFSDVELKSMAANIIKPISLAVAAELENNQPEADKHWADYGEALYSELTTVFKDLRLDDNGERTDNSGIRWDWLDWYENNGSYSERPLQDMKRGGLYGIYDYTFHYDWRLDMYTNAEYLNAYIEDVLDVTGAEKCVLISRCYGCNLVTAYLQSYGYDAVENCMLYCSTAVGSVVCSEIFCGEVSLNADGLDLYLADLFGGKNPIKQLVGENTDTLIGMGVEWSVNKILEKVGDDVIPKVLMETFGTMPGYWSMVDSEHFEAAKEYAFKGREEKFDGLIKKIDFYHYTTLQSVEDIIMEGFDSGMKYANITKYGSQMVPVIENLDFVGDSIVEVTSASLGATTTRVNETFEEEYVASAFYDGYYISPERQIDAITALIPDCTWFVKGIDHFSFPEAVDELLLAIARYDGQMTVFSYDAFPMYLEYESDENVLDYGADKFFDSNSEFARIFKIVMAFFETIVGIISAIFGI